MTPFVFDIVQGEGDALHYVVDTWSRTYIKSFHWNSIREKAGDYGLWMRARMSRLLERSIVLVMTDEEHPEHFLGWICGETSDRGLVLHYCHLKPWEREKGRFLLMVEELEQRLELSGKERRYTHRTRCTRGWDAHGWSFAPHLVGGGEDTAWKPGSTVH